MTDSSHTDQPATSTGREVPDEPQGRIDALHAKVSPLEGPNTIGATPRFWMGVGLVVLFALVYPLLTNTYQLIVNSVFLVWVILALSLTLVWGYAGIFSFGQTAFFGLGGYVFGIVGINLVGTTGGTNAALLAAIFVPGIFAAVIGYFIFYGRISGVYVGIITFAATLILGLSLSRTSGTSIGAAKLGGLNGMTTVPSMVFGVGETTVTLDHVPMYYFTVCSLVVVYVGLRYLVNSDIGYVMVAVREDEERTEMFGYDVRRVKLLVFVAGAGLAGFAGALYASAGNFVSPNLMGLTAAALPVIWVTVGGRTSLLGAIVGAFGLQYLDQKISLLGSEFSLILLAMIVIAAILFFPQGIVPTVTNKVDSLGSARSTRAVSSSNGGEGRE